MTTNRIKTGRRVAWGVAGLVLAVLVIAQVLGPREPRYQGKRLSEYLRALSDDGYQVSSEPPYGVVGVFAPSVARTEAWEALPHFGEEAIPALVALAERWRDPWFTRAVNWLGNKAPLLQIRMPTAAEKQSQAVAAFRCLGSRGVSAVPTLLPLLKDRRTARAAAYALTFIQPNDKASARALCDAIPCFEGQTVLQVDVIAALTAYDRQAAEVAPAIERCLTSTNDEVSAAAAAALSRLGLRTRENAMLIAGRLSGAARRSGYMAPPLEMRLWALGRFGPAARDALPLISGFTNDASGSVRRLAVDTIRAVEVAVEFRPPELSRSHEETESQ